MNEDEEFVPECDFCDEEIFMQEDGKLVNEYGDSVDVIRCDSCDRTMCSNHIWWCKRSKYGLKDYTLCASCKFQLKRN